MSLTRPTSKAAFDAMSSAMPGMRGRVYEFVKRLGTWGATDEEMQDGLPMNPNTQRPRRGDLEKAGFIKDSGRTRPTKSSCDAVVWVIAEFVPPIFEEDGQMLMFELDAVAKGEGS